MSSMTKEQVREALARCTVSSNKKSVKMVLEFIGPERAKNEIEEMMEALF